MTEQEIELCGRNLRSTLPIIGANRRRAAVRRLADEISEAAIPHLCWAAHSGDPETSGVADRALRRLREGPVRDALCRKWSEERDGMLGRLIVECQYVAQKPLELAVLTALKAKSAPQVWPVDAGRLLLQGLKDADPDVRSQADAEIRRLPKGPVCDAICEIAIRDPNGDAAKVCDSAGLLPAEQGRLCLLLFVTRKLDTYFKEDDNFRYLRAEYDAADPTVQEHVLSVVRSGDRRCGGFLGGRKQLRECTEVEIGVAIDSAAGHRDWARLFRAVQELPLKYGLPVVEMLRTSGWSPEDPAARRLLEQVLADTAGLQAIEERAKPDSSPFSQMLAAGADPKYASQSEADLMRLLEGSDPPAGVGIVAALAKKVAPGSPNAEKVLASPHWMVRLAGFACGLSADLRSTTVNDPVYWVRELARPSAALDLWVCDGGPKDMEALDSGGLNKALGRMGVARRALRTLLAYRLASAVVWEPVEVKGGEFSVSWDDED